jgi:hypothetical protein
MAEVRGDHQDAGGHHDHDRPFEGIESTEHESSGADPQQ